jgi:hypothetical protein
VAPLDESGDQLLHLRDVRRRPRFIGRLADAERAIAGRELLLDPVRERPPLLRVARVREDLVVDVGDVADEVDAVPAVLEPPPPQVVDERAAEVPDVRRRLHRRTADVDPDPAVDERHEVAQLLLLRVVEPDRHPSSLLSRAVAMTATPSPRPVKPR